jgi:predicted RNA binding protein YcfA (HicA-like mRNA interferase family)
LESAVSKDSSTVVDGSNASATLRKVTSREVIKQLIKFGCVELRQKGSHKFYVSPCGNCFTTVADHSGDIKTGTLNGIRKDMAPCLGDDWLARKK